ncbi:MULTISPECIES: hypothetical protein [Nostocales]|uniref:Uncharacterized protein n=2 Tax=Nostocales TaxID=1161 RepID=A0ABW8WJC3_9CYAN|nr:hypothetical protein [Tolypothrix bouteillei]
MSQEEKEILYHAKLIRYGVDLKIAAKVAKILASGNSDDSLTPEDKKLVTDICQFWLEKRNHLKRLNLLSLTDNFPSNQISVKHIKKF